MLLRVKRIDPSILRRMLFGSTDNEGLFEGQARLAQLVVEEPEFTGRPRRSVESQLSQAWSGQRPIPPGLVAALVRIAERQAAKLGWSPERVDELLRLLRGASSGSGSSALASCLLSSQEVWLVLGHAEDVEGLLGCPGVPSALGEILQDGKRVNVVVFHPAGRELCGTLLTSEPLLEVLDEASLRRFVAQGDLRCLEQTGELVVPALLGEFSTERRRFAFLLPSAILAREQPPLGLSDRAALVLYDQALHRAARVSPEDLGDAIWPLSIQAPERGNARARRSRDAK